MKKPPGNRFMAIYVRKQGVVLADFYFVFFISLSSRSSVLRLQLFFMFHHHHQPHQHCDPEPLISPGRRPFYL